jgi:hypothetical protein
MNLDKFKRGEYRLSDGSDKRFCKGTWLLVHIVHKYFEVYIKKICKELDS